MIKEAETKYAKPCDYNMPLVLPEINNTLQEVVSIISKTVSGDLPLIYEILFNGLSAFTDKPSNLQIAQKSSEGKTYPVLQISQYFPKENVLTLGSITPQAFKYELGEEVTHDYKPLQKELQEIDEQKKLLKEKSGIEISDKLKELEEQKKELEQNKKFMIDLHKKWIIFKEPPDPHLLQALYSTLSNDEEFNEHKFVNRVSGKNQTFTVVFRGSPAMLICTAKDESKNERWEETHTRFHTISPKSTARKYREGMGLISKASGLPKVLYQEQVINSEDKKRAKYLIQELIKQIQDQDGEILNPFMTELDKIFPQESGYRWRQYERFLQIMKLHCLCYSRFRPNVILNDKKVPIVTMADIEFASSLYKDDTSIAPNKLEWFRETFLRSWEKCEDVKIFRFTKKCITGNEIVKYISETTQAKVTVKQIRETYLEPLIEHGIIDKDRDPRNMTRDVYWPAEGHEQFSNSSLIAITSLSETGVKSFLDEALEQRFSYEIHGEEIDQEKTIEYILSNQNVI